MELENGQFDYKDSNQSYDDVFGSAPKDILDEIQTKDDFNADLFMFWLFML